MSLSLQFVWGPITRRADGTFVFAAPIGNGHIPLVSLKDIGYFARYTFDHRHETSGRDLEITSDMVSLEQLVSTFKRVTGQKAVAVHLSVEEWFENFKNTDYPLATERQYGDGSTTWKQNFTAFFNLYRDDIIKRDMAWVRSVHPNGHSLESWMREYNYKGDFNNAKLLKNTEDGKWSVLPDFDRIAATLGYA